VYRFGTGLYDGLVTCSEESYRRVCIIVCDIEPQKMRWSRPEFGCRTTERIIVILF